MRGQPQAVVARSRPHDPRRLRQRALSALCRGCGARRGSRVPVRRRGLRGVRGQRRAAGRRDAAHAAPHPLARRAAHPATHGTSRLVTRAARDDPAQPGGGRHHLSAGFARRRPARLPVPGRGRAADRCVSRPQRFPAPAGGNGREGHRHPDHAGYALGPLRHQDGDAAARGPSQGGGTQPGRQGGLVRRRQGLRDRGRLVQRLDPRQAGPPHHPPGRCRYPQGRHPHHLDRSA